MKTSTDLIVSHLQQWRQSINMIFVNERKRCLLRKSNYLSRNNNRKRVIGICKLSEMLGHFLMNNSVVLFVIREKHSIWFDWLQGKYLCYFILHCIMKFGIYYQHTVKRSLQPLFFAVISSIRDVKMNIHIFRGTFHNRKKWRHWGRGCKF